MAKTWKWIVVGIALICFSAAIYFWIESKSLSSPVIKILSGEEMQSIFL